VNEKEQKLLNNLSRLLGNPEVSESAFKQIEEAAAKKEKERKLLEQFENALLGVAAPKKIEEKSEVIVETFVDKRNETTRQITQPNSAATPVEPQPKVPETIIKSAPPEIPPAMRKEIDQLKKTVLNLHQFASRISQMGGGGAGSVDELTFRAIGVNTNYTAKNHDYYIGVNCPTTCTITLPPLKKSGYQIVVKDESGQCAINNITVVASNGDTIDNDTSAIMGINNMSLTFIYRNGWRII